ncbi:MAG: glycosyltransferase [Flavobacteriales bacterium]|nr:glycosyltransferase [Flavobacteriales bacterium]
MTSRKKILVFSEWYLPGFKAGGPIRSVAEMVRALGDEFDFYVCTTNRDLGSANPYPEVPSDTWVQVGSAKVLYLEPSAITRKKIRSLLTAQPWDFVCLNSMFAMKFAIMPLILHGIFNTPGQLVLAPRGMLGAGALAIKSFKKKVFLAILKTTGLTRRIMWQVTSAEEAVEVRSVFGPSAHICLTGNIFSLRPLTPREGNVKMPGILKLIFLSRISPKKNLLYALQRLQKLPVKGQVVLDVYGPPEDGSYWDECQQVIAQLPPSVQVSYKGELPSAQVGHTFTKYHFFFFPTRHENFGHVIIESLGAGCPVILSDQTPWRNLESEKAGWDVPLEDSLRFESILVQCLDMGSQVYEEWSMASRRYAEAFERSQDAIQQHRNMFGGTIPVN